MVDSLVFKAFTQNIVALKPEATHQRAVYKKTGNVNGQKKGIQFFDVIAMSHYQPENENIGSLDDEQKDESYDKKRKMYRQQSTFGHGSGPLKNKLKFIFKTRKYKSITLNKNEDESGDEQNDVAPSRGSLWKRRNSEKFMVYPKKSTEIQSSMSNCIQEEDFSLTESENFEKFRNSQLREQNSEGRIQNGGSNSQRVEFRSEQNPENNRSRGSNSEREGRSSQYRQSRYSQRQSRYSQVQHRQSRYSQRQSRYSQRQSHFSERDSGFSVKAQLSCPDLNNLEESKLITPNGNSCRASQRRFTQLGTFEISTQDEDTRLSKIESKAFRRLREQSDRGEIHNEDHGTDWRFARVRRSLIRPTMQIFLGLNDENNSKFKQNLGLIEDNEDRESNSSSDSNIKEPTFITQEQKSTVQGSMAIPVSTSIGSLRHSKQLGDRLLAKSENAKRVSRVDCGSDAAEHNGNDYAAMHLKIHDMTTFGRETQMPSDYKSDVSGPGQLQIQGNAFGRETQMPLDYKIKNAPAPSMQLNVVNAHEFGRETQMPVFINKSIATGSSQLNVFNAHKFGRETQMPVDCNKSPTNGSMQLLNVNATVSETDQSPRTDMTSGLTSSDGESNETVPVRSLITRSELIPDHQIKEMNIVRGAKSLNEDDFKGQFNQEGPVKRKRSSMVGGRKQSRLTFMLPQFSEQNEMNISLFAEHPGIDTVPENDEEEEIDIQQIHSKISISVPEDGEDTKKKKKSKRRMSRLDTTDVNDEGDENTLPPVKSKNGRRGTLSVEPIDKQRRSSKCPHNTNRDGIQRRSSTINRGPRNSIDGNFLAMSNLNDTGILSLLTQQ